MPWLALFLNPRVLGSIAVIAVLGFGVVWHQHRTAVFGAARYQAGVLDERGKWQTAVADLKAENARRAAQMASDLQAAEQALADKQAALRDAKESRDAMWLQLQGSDAASNRFDDRVVRALRRGVRPE
jgi:hypothetical protein